MEIFTPLAMAVMQVLVVDMQITFLLFMGPALIFVDVLTIEAMVVTVVLAMSPSFFAANIASLGTSQDRLLHLWRSVSLGECLPLQGARTGASQCHGTPSPYSTNHQSC